MPAKALMIVGTSSHAGKSVVATAFCRLFREMGYSVAPFKAQNMSNNSFVTLEGGEMGRAQVAQAVAAGVEPHVDMNPVLLKPATDQRSQVIVQGRPIGTMPARAYYESHALAWSAATESYARLASRYEVIVMEGAGSPVEVNLRDRDIVNMRMALHAQAPTILVADIERGGVFASVVGTYHLLRPEESALMCGTLINKLRGDPTLFGDGPAILERETGVPVLGVLPYLFDLRVDEEDGVDFEKLRAGAGAAEVVLAVPALPRVSNLTDFAPLWALPGAEVRAVTRPEHLAGADCVLLPGTKTTLADLDWLERTGLAAAIVALHRERGVPVVGLCGGFQMLGRRLRDPTGAEGGPTERPGLGLLPIDTVFGPEQEKITRQVRVAATAEHPFLGPAVEIEGYEIHAGASDSAGAPPAHVFRERGGLPAAGPEGAAVSSAGSYVLGTYLHGYFDRSDVSGAFMNDLRRRKGLPPLPLARGAGMARAERQVAYARLAAALREHVRLDVVFKALGLPVP